MSKRRALLFAAGAVAVFLVLRRLRQPTHAAPATADPAAQIEPGFDASSFGLYGYDSGAFGPESLGAVVSSLQSIESNWTAPMGANPTTPIAPTPPQPHQAPPIGKPPGIVKPPAPPAPSTSGVITARIVPKPPVYGSN